MTTATKTQLNKYSSRITQPASQGASQAMLIATGLTWADLNKPQVGIGARLVRGQPVQHAPGRPRQPREGGRRGSRTASAMRFNTIGVSDGISMGTDGMSFSLQSRDLIADSIETIMGAQWYDAPGRPPRLRQEHARLRHGDGPAQPPVDHGLRRHDPRRAARRSAATRRSSTSSPRFQAYGQKPRRARSPRTSARRSSASACPGQAPAAGCTPPTRCRRSSSAMGLSLPYSSSHPGRGPGEDRRVRPRRRGDPQAARAGPQAARHRHPRRASSTRCG